MAESFKNCKGALRPFLPLFTYNILSIEFTFSLITRLCDLNLTCLERILLLTICLFNTSSVYHSVSAIQANLKDMLKKQLSENNQWKWNELTVLLTILQSVGLQIFKSSSQQCASIKIWKKESVYFFILRWAPRRPSCPANHTSYIPFAS